MSSDFFSSKGLSMKSFAFWDELPGVHAEIGPCIDEEPALAVLVGDKEAVGCRSADVSRRWRLQR
jgi:hypothetical protein